MKTISVSDLRGKLGIKSGGGTARPMPARQFASAMQSERMSDLERAFGLRWRTLYPDLEFETEHQFHPHHKYRFDVVFTKGGAKVAIELNGGIWQRGKEGAGTGHSSGTGLTRDYTKGNLAISMGWAVFQLSEAMARDRVQLEQIAATVRARMEKKQSYE